MSKLFSYRRIGVFILLVLAQSLPTPATASEDAIKQADTLNQQGLHLLDAGKTDQALRVLKQAKTLYERLNNTTGIYGALINQSLVYEQMGQYHSACSTLTQVLSLDREICRKRTEFSQDDLKVLLKKTNKVDPSQRIIALNNLGNILRFLGQLETSEMVLQQALPHSGLLNSEDQYTILLSLANTHQSLYKQAINQYSISSDPSSQADALNKAQDYAQSALDYYQKVAENQSEDQIRAQLNVLQLILHLRESHSSAFVSTHQHSQNLISPYLKNLLATDFSQFPTHESIHLQLKLSHLLAEADLYQIPSSENNLSLAYEVARAALRQAETYGDRRLISQAYGVFGTLYVQSEQLDDAIQVLTKALKLAQSIQDDHLAYQWSWQLAQIYQQRGQTTRAIATYDTTIKHLDQVRTLLVSANADLQFNFKESVEPVYHNYLQLLLSTPNPDLQLVLTTHNQLQVAELENYLKCGKLTTAQTNDQQASYASTIHIFELNGQVEVIAKTQNGIFRHQPDSSVVQAELSRLLNFLHSDSFEEISEAHFRRNAQTLYGQIIAPLKDHLPPTGDLLFVLDSNYQNLPLSMLHDGQQYLIESYTVTNALNTHLQPLQPQNLEQLNVLFAGLSKDSPSFTKPDVPQNLAPLPEIEDELAGVVEVSNQITYLLNDEFTTDRLQANLQRDIPIIHVASHGQFSSDPELTFLLAYNEPITANEFHDLISQKSELGQASIELLVLSACQTAKGDRKSALGIAGLAVQAGSRNTLASLWLAESEATATLITTFYEGLDNNLPKAKALQQAQIKLLDSEEYWHPYFWGNFILVGS